MAKKNYFKNNQNVHQQGIVKINDIKIYNIILLCIYNLFQVSPFQEITF